MPPSVVIAAVEPSAVPPCLSEPAGPANVDRTVARRWLMAVAVVVVVVGALIWRFEPRGQFFFPRCWLHENTGLLCPGCGSTRALHALLNGEFRAAWRFNPLAVLGVPLAGAFAIRQVRGLWTGRWWPNPLGNRYVIACLLGTVFGFGVLRNVPAFL